MKLAMCALVLCSSLASASSVLSTSRVLSASRVLAQPAPLSTALALRGGGAVEPSTFISAATAFFGAYSLGFLVDPQMLTTLNFAGVPALDTFHKWLCRILACGWLSYLGAVNLAENKGDMVKVVLAASAACTFLGPVTVEFLNPKYFQPTMLHKVHPHDPHTTPHHPLNPSHDPSSP